MEILSFYFVQLKSASSIVYFEYDSIIKTSDTIIMYNFKL